MLIQINVPVQILLGPFLFQQQHAVAQLLGEIEGRHIREDASVFHLGHVQYVGSHVGQTQGLALDDVQIFQPLLLAQVAAL